MHRPTDLVQPPYDCSVTIPETIEFHWKHNSAFPAYVYNEDGTPDITEISYLEFGRAAHRAAHALRPNRNGPGNDVVAFIALTDTIQYHANFIGLMKAGLIPFPISPRNTAAAVVNLLKKTNCHRMIATQVTLKSLLGDIKADIAANDPEFALEIEEIPPLSLIYPNLGKETEQDHFEPYPEPETRTPITNIALYLHSSGSTGFAKPIAHTHEAMVHWASFPCISELREYPKAGSLAAMHMPSFHVLGIYSQMLLPLYGCVPTAVYPPTAKAEHLPPVMPTPENVLDHTQRTRSITMVTVPAFLQIWAQNPKSVDLLRNLDIVLFSGGAVARKIGDFLSTNGVNLRPIYGATEIGSPTNIFPRQGDETDWAWFAFCDKANPRWIPHSDNKFECQLLTSNTHRVSVENLSDVKGYGTSDLMERHPTKHYLWRVVGRADDVIIHSSGEKTVPTHTEDLVMSSPLVMGVVMFGRNHDQPGILIEPKAEHAIDIDDEQQLTQFRNQIWPVVEEANKSVPGYSKIYKELIILTRIGKPLPRAGKGTVMRKLALKVYEGEIEALYATIESTAKGGSVKPPVSWSEKHIKLWLLEQATDIIAGQYDPSRDLFEQGFDSLSATVLRLRIAGTLQSADNTNIKGASTMLSQTTIYQYPTIDRLSVYLAALVADPQHSLTSKSHKEVIEDMISKYSVGFGTIPTHISHPTEVVVLITGTTGNLGSQVLQYILQDDNVKRVYALNRPSASRTILDRHNDRFKDKALDSSLLTSPKLIYIEGDTAEDTLGLQPVIYDELRNTVTTIIHTAWRLDFNLTLTSYEPNIRGTRNLIDLALSGPHASSVRFLFTSSIASTSSWDQSKGAYPEEVLTDASYAVGNGYGEGKYVVERLLEKSGLQATSLRIGQISGGHPNGAWATTDWVPILVKSSFTLGSLPLMHGVVSWLPMDIVAKAILEAASTKDTTARALNLVHPRPIAWNSLLKHINDTLTKDRKLSSPLPTIPVQEWFATLERSAQMTSPEEQVKIPAIKLLEFFRRLSDSDVVIAKSGDADTKEAGGLAKLSTTKTQAISNSINNAAEIGADDAMLWVKYWNDAGLFG